MRMILPYMRVDDLLPLITRTTDVKIYDVAEEKEIAFFEAGDEIEFPHYIVKGLRISDPDTLMILAEQE